mgnify:CR=1 FL=1
MLASRSRFWTSTSLISASGLVPDSSATRLPGAPCRLPPRGRYLAKLTIVPRPAALWISNESISRRVPTIPTPMPVGEA